MGVYFMRETMEGNGGVSGILFFCVVVGLIFFTAWYFNTPVDNTSCLTKSADGVGSSTKKETAQKQIANIPSAKGGESRRYAANP